MSAKQLENIRTLAKESNADSAVLIGRDDNGHLVSVTVHLEEDNDHDAKALLDWLKSRGIEE